MKEINIIVAIDKNNAIGKDNKLLYWLPNDLKRFKALTVGNVVLMGRKTFESLPKGALPDRRNIVVSRDKNLKLIDAEIYHSIDEAINACKDNEKIFIIGGASVYEETISRADNLYVTKIDAQTNDADAFFPIIDTQIWKQINEESHQTDEKHSHSYTFIDYTRKK